jgi:non-heme chloroperoxidase
MGEGGGMGMPPSSLNPVRVGVSFMKHKGGTVMSSGSITVKDGTQIYYKDWGSGQPIVFHHGWPLSSDDWDAQMMFFLAQGYRVIAHDRRGHGRSSQTETGNEMDTYAADVAELARHLDLRNAVHVGHSTGGGEVTRDLLAFIKGETVA